MREEEKESWSKEFDKKFVGITQGTKRVWWVDDPDRVKQFISSELSRQRAELLEKLKKVRTGFIELKSGSLEMPSFGQPMLIIPSKALDDLLNEIK